MKPAYTGKRMQSKEEGKTDGTRSNGAKTIEGGQGKRDGRQVPYLYNTVTNPTAYKP